MIWFEYKYNSPSQITNDINIFLDYSNNEYIIILLIFSLFIITLLYIFPIIDIFIEYRKNENLKKEKKKIIQRMILRKNIESEIEKELNI